MRLTLVEHSSDQFTFDASDETFTACASDLNNRHLERIYDDACDVGLAIKSAKTGVVITYYMDKTHYDREHDITHWTYKPCSEDVRKHPEAIWTEVIIFND
jgi:hypothetical protein